MPYELYLRHYDRAGDLKNAVVNPLWARFTESVSGQEPLVFALDVAYPLDNPIEEFDIFEVMLRNRELGLVDFTRAFVAIQRHTDLAANDDGKEVLVFTAPGERHILSWRHVLWYAGVSNRSEFHNVPAETILKTLVAYNLTGLATVANGRQREGDLGPGMGVDVTVAADGADGEVLSIACMGANVLSVLQKIVEGGSAGGDFSFNWQGGPDWTFDFHPGQLGEDKSSGADRVLFAMVPGNNTMLRPRLIRTGAGATTAISAGKGEGLERAITPVDGPDYAADYDIETFVDARNEATEEGRETRGLIRLDEVRAHEQLSFEVLQTANQFYSPVAVTGRKTYRAGDLVLATYGSEQVRKIESVEVNWNVPDREDAFQVSVTTREVSGA